MYHILYTAMRPCITPAFISIPHKAIVEYKKNSLLMLVAWVLFHVQFFWSKKAHIVDATYAVADESSTGTWSNSCRVVRVAISTKTEIPPEVIYRNIWLVLSMSILNSISVLG